MSGGKRSPSIAPLKLQRRGRDGEREWATEGQRLRTPTSAAGRQTHGKYWARCQVLVHTHRLLRVYARAQKKQCCTSRESGRVRVAEAWALERGRDAEQGGGEEQSRRKDAVLPDGELRPCSDLPSLPPSLSLFLPLTLFSVYYLCTFILTSSPFPCLLSLLSSFTPSLLQTHTYYLYIHTFIIKHIKHIKPINRGAYIQCYYKQ